MSDIDRFKPVPGFAMPPRDVLEQIAAREGSLAKADEEAEQTCAHGKTPGCDECAEVDDDNEERDCFHCGGEGYHECPDPIECTSPHLRGDYRSGLENHRCDSCGGSGRAKDMTIW